MLMSPFDHKNPVDVQSSVKTTLCKKKGPASTGKSRESREQEAKHEKNNNHWELQSEAALVIGSLGEGE